MVRTAEQTRLSGFSASSASAVFLAGSVAGKIATAGIPSSTAVPTAASSRSTDNRSTPGIDGMDSRRLTPSCTKTGQIKSLTESECSRTSRRAQSSLRLRRGRVCGNFPKPFEPRGKESVMIGLNLPSQIVKTWNLPVLSPGLTATCVRSATSNVTEVERNQNGPKDHARQFSVLAQFGQGARPT